MTARPSATRDEGAAVVEFVLVGVLLTTLFVGLLQLGLALHVRNTLLAAAAEGARYGANADRSPADGAAVTRDIVADALSAYYAVDVSAREELLDGLPTVVVEVRAPLPVFGLLGPGGAITVRGHAIEESAA